MKSAPLAVRILVTLVLVVAALAVARWMWLHYQVEPWTRDGRVRADVAQVSADVSGLVTAVDVIDNTPVRKGQRLFALDQPRFALALQQADAALRAQTAAVQVQTAALAQARREDARNRKLGDLTPGETVEQGTAKIAQLEATVAQMQAAVAQAAVARDTARLNLTRTAVYAPIDGTVANASLRPGDYLTAGRAAIAVVDASTLHVDGYFEETKLARIRVGDRATVQLVGDPRLLAGHVESIAPGIEDRERGPGGDLLPNVNPTFNWVRLAQRIPVRIRLDQTVGNVALIAGRTATVVVHPSGARKTVRFWPW
jgi:multidrug resistance efflux pump